MPDSTLSSLANIRIKVRRLTQSPSTSQLTDDAIDEYVDNFVLYDFPAIEKLRYLQDELIFYTQPNIDTYETSAVAADLLYNYKNIYTSFFSPIYVDGSEITLNKSKESFYLLNPKNTTTTNLTTGNGVTVAYAGTLGNIPILRNEVSFVSVDINSEGLAVYDDGVGGLDGDCLAGGTINYITGAYSFTFTTAPLSGQDIVGLTMVYVANKPSSILYDGEKFVVRPVPDRPYKINITATKRPTQLLIGASVPELAQWWQYISYGAAKKVLEDRNKTELLQKIMPTYLEQEELVLNRTIEDYSDQRSTTIYSSSYLNSGDINDI